MPAEPVYIYKILPPATPPPSPLPHALPVSPLDAADGYIHASTAPQLLHTLRKFFAADTSVHLLRMRYAAVKHHVRWETTTGQPGQVGQPGCFPHLYNGLVVGREQVERVGEWVREGAEWSGVSGWPFGDEDVPA